MLADLGENPSIIHLEHNIFLISYISLKARGERETRMVEDWSCLKVIENRGGAPTLDRIVGMGCVEPMIGLWRTEKTTPNLKLRVRCMRNSPKYMDSFLVRMGMSLAVALRRSHTATRCDWTQKVDVSSQQNNFAPLLMLPRKQLLLPSHTGCRSEIYYQYIAV